MEKKIDLLREFLSVESGKTNEEIKQIDIRLERIGKTTSDEFALDGDYETGEKNKESMLYELNQQKSMCLGIQAQIERFENMLKFSEPELEYFIQRIKDMSIEGVETRDEMVQQARTQLMKQPVNYHVDWCPLHGSDKPWGVDEECVCPGAYVVRKRMNDGMSLIEAKLYLIDNEMI